MSAKIVLSETVHASVEDLRETAAALGAEVWAIRFSALRKRLMGGQLSLAVIGQFKRGKSTLINALLGADVLPTAVVPLTSVVTVLEHGANPRCKVQFEDGREVWQQLQALWDYATEASNPGNEKGVRQIVVQYPGPLLTRGVRIVDTPGIGSVYEHNTDVTLSFLPQVDAALFILSVDPPLTKVELDFLHEARAYAGKILFVMNKIDAFEEEAVNEALGFTRDVLKTTVAREGLEVLSLSAKEALVGKQQGDGARVERSGIPALEARLDRLLQWERANSVGLAVAKAASAAGREFDFTLRLSEEAIKVPADVLESKIRSFSLELERAEVSRREILGLVETESSAIAAQLDEDLRAFRETASRQIFEELSLGLQDRHIPLRRARAEAERRLEELIGRTFNPWVESETALVNERFATSARRLEGRLRDHLLTVRQSAADLFDIPTPPFTGELSLASQSNLYYLVGSPEPFLPMPEWRDVLAFLPRRFALPRMLQILREEVWTEVDRNAGRVRHDLMERLAESTRRLRSSIVGLLSAEVDGLWAALQVAQKRRSEGREAVESRLAQLGAARGRVAECLEQLKGLV